MNVFEDGEEREKVIVKSNETATYLGKDIAYQMWKFGILGKDFYYKKFNNMYIKHLLLIKRRKFHLEKVMLFIMLLMWDNHTFKTH